MAEGLSVSLPLRVDPTDGAYGLNKTLTQMAAQNLRMIILTAPGERVMSPNYGVGVRHYLFEQNSPGTISGLRNRISKQISTYLPYIQVMNLEVASPTIPGGGPGATDNTRINISIRYRVPSANIVSDLTIPVTI
jgi:phage baseplate assembly protein W